MEQSQEQENKKMGHNEMMRAQDEDPSTMDRSNSATPVSIEGKGAKQKVPVKYIANRARRHVTFAKRRHGIMKKAYELSVLTGANVLLLILSKSGLVYTFTTPKLERIVREQEGKRLIRQCLQEETMGETT